MKTMERYKRENRRPFPTWSEVLEVLISMGFRKVEPEGIFPASNARRLRPRAKDIASSKLEVTSLKTAT